MNGSKELDGDYVHVSEKTADSLASCCLLPGDLVFPHRGNIGQVGITPDDGYRYMLSTSLMKLSPDRTRADPLYLMYFFKSDQGRAALLMNASQVGTPGIATPLKSLRGIKFQLPPLPIQQRIAKILGALDDRITLLRDTNTTLEAIAQSIYKSWFVDFDPVRAKADGRMPEGMDEATAALFPDGFEKSELGLVPSGWRSGVLGEICMNYREGARPESLDDTTAYFGLEHLPKKSISLSNWGSAHGLESGKFRFKAFDLLFGKLRPYFHKVGFAPVDGVCSTDILVVRPTSPAWYGLTLAHLSSSALIDYATQLSNGAKMPRTNWSDLSSYRIAIPPANCAAAFDGIARAFVERIQANILTMRTLAELRDLLLPRLISGRLQLPEAEHVIAEVASQ